MHPTHFCKTISKCGLFIVPFFLVVMHFSTPLLAEWLECGQSKDHKIFRRMRPPTAQEDRFEFAVTRQAKTAAPADSPNHIGDDEIVATFSLIDTLRQTHTHGTPMPFEVFEVHTMGDHSNGAIQSLLSVYVRLGYGCEDPGTQIGFLFNKAYSAMGSFLGQNPESPVREMGFTLYEPTPSRTHCYPTLTGATKTIGEVDAVLMAAPRDRILEQTKASFVSLSR